jgi:hypothetical protein
MQFSEDDLRRALRRKTPGPDFAQRVLARIEQAESKPVHSKLVAKPAVFSFRFWPRRIAPMAPIAAFAAMLAVAVGLLQYDRYETHVKQENARKQAVLGLQITSATLNQALHRALVRSEKPQ